MQLIYRWLIGDMGNPGDYQYQSIHLYCVIAVLAVTVFTIWAGTTKRFSPKIKDKILKGICWFQIAFEVLWRLIYLFVKKDSILCWWPIYPCNLNGVVIPIIALCNWKKGKQLFYLFGFVGGVLTFALPEGIFSSDVLVFPIVKSILQHTGLLMIPLFEFGDGRYRPSIKDMGWVIVGLLIHLVNSEGIARLLGFWGDYMFFRSGMPFVIPGVPQFFTLSVFALLLLTLLSALGDWVNKKFPKESEVLQ